MCKIAKRDAFSAILTIIAWFVTITIIYTNQDVSFNVQ